MKLLYLGCFAAVLCSCSVVEPVWEGAKMGTNTVVNAGEDVVSTIWTEGVYGAVTSTEEITGAVWGGGKDLFGTGVGSGENAVYGAYDFVTDPFTADEE